MRKTLAAVTTLSILATGLPAMAEEGANPFEFHNRLRLEYDDNIFETNLTKEESWKIIEEPIFRLKTKQANTFIQLDYMPSLIYWFDRPSDDTDLQHQLDAALTQDFSPRTTLSLRETFRYSELPELIQDDVIVRGNNDYLYNSFSAALRQGLTQTTSVEFEGRHVVLAYDDSALADTSDYTQVTGGADLIHQASPNTAISGQFRFTSFDYEDDLRDADSTQIGLALNQVVGKSLALDLRGGFEEQDYDSAAKNTTDSPYGDIGLVFTPNPDTRINIGAGYSLAQTPTSKFTSQERFTMRAGLAQKLSARLALSLTGSFTMGSFDADQSTAAFNSASDTEGDEDILRLSAKMNYEINKRNFLEASYQYVELESDIRDAQDYDRSRISLGWRTVIN